MYSATHTGVHRRVDVSDAFRCVSFIVILDLNVCLAVASRRQ